MKPHPSLHTLFNEALEQDDPAGRARYLEAACGGDDALRESVERLLGAHEAAGGFFAAPSRTPSLAFPMRERAGDWIGPYKLLEPLGEGGCGVVYLAEQSEPVCRQVALKVIKAGMDTRQVIARFEAERQALAMMEHPNIARVLEAGTTDSGRPFFVMELVRGIKITDYCDQNQLSARERLELFIPVCQAIQHAHQKGIIHRDLKPSNILVTTTDPASAGVPKVIDFGIAKATGNQRLTDLTLFTAIEQFIGTPAYMSPEQAELSGMDLDTRTDIYSLGVVLYELLTGRTPFDTRELLRCGLDEIRRTIRETEPPKPSTRLHTLTQAELTTAAQARLTDAPKLVHQVRGDLDWIVMKCLEKDRNRRYESVNGLAMDVQRHLNHEPVLACPPGNLYRFKKLVRRNKLAFAAGAAVLLALLGGITASTWQAVRATRAEHAQINLRQEAEAERRKSETEAAKATAISDFLQQLLGSANPDALKGSEYSVRQLLDDFSAGLENQFADQPEVEATVRATIGRAYRRLGATNKAEAHLDRALGLRRKVFGNQSEQVAEVLLDSAWNCLLQKQFTKGEAYAREGLGIYRNAIASDQSVISALLMLHRILKGQGRLADADSAAREAFAISQKSPDMEFPEMASLLHWQSETKSSQKSYAEAESLARQAIEMHRRLRGEEHPEVAWATLSLGVALEGQQKLTDAEAAFRESLRIFSQYYSPGHMSVDQVIERLKRLLQTSGDSAGIDALASQQLSLLNNRIQERRLAGRKDLEFAGVLQSLFFLHRDLGNHPEAEAAIREALAVRRRLLGDEHFEVGDTLFNLADVLVRQGTFAEAESLRREALALRRKLFGPANPHVVWAISQLAAVLRAQGKLDEAETLHRAALDSQVKHFGHESREVSNALVSLAGVLRERGKFADAEVATREGLAIERKLLGDEHPFVANSLEQLGMVLREAGKLGEAETVFREALAMRRRLLGDDHPGVSNSLSWLGLALQDQGKHAETEVAYREALEISRKLFGDEHLDVAISLSRFGSALLAQSKHAEAETAFHESLRIRRKLLGDEHPDVAISLSKLGVTLLEQGKHAEAEAMFRVALAMRRNLLGDEHPDVAISLSNLGGTLWRQGKHPEAEAMFREELLSRRKLPADDHQLCATLAVLTNSLLMQDKFSEAEAVARECLALREKIIPDDWATFNARSMLGGSLLGQKKYAEAEPLLISGYEGMKEREEIIPAEARLVRFREAIQRLVHLYEATEQPEKAGAWKQDLAAIEAAEKKPAAP